MNKKTYIRRKINNKNTEEKLNIMQLHDSYLYVHYRPMYVNIMFQLSTKNGE